MVQRIADEVIAPKTLNCEYLSAIDHRVGDIKYFLIVSTARKKIPAAGIKQEESWTTLGAGGGLRVKAPIKWIFVLSPASLAHREVTHRGPCSVVRNVFDDGEARTAVSAVNKGIAVTAILRVEQLGETIDAGSDVGRDGNKAFFVHLALGDAKL